MSEPIPKAKELCLRYQGMRSSRSSCEPIWQSQVDYFVPNRPSVITKKQPGSKRTEKLFDSTALDCVNRLSAAMAGNLTPMSSKWFFLKMRDPELNEDHETREWLEDCARRMMQAYTQSNFSAEINELYPDIIVFGTGCMFQEEKPLGPAGMFGGLTFRTYGPGSYCIDEDYDGMVDTVFREFQLSARVAYDRWGDAVRQSLKIRQALESVTKRDMMFPFLQCVFPRDPRDVSRGKVIPKTRMKYANVIVSLDDQKIIEEGGFHEFPAVVPRWSKASDETYGRGLGHIALPDVATLNRARDLGLKSWAKEIDPPLLERDQAVIGNPKLTPGGRTIVQGTGALDEMLRPLDLRIRHDASRFNLEELKQGIRAIFFTDQLRMKDSPQMTAEEVRARMDMMHRVLGPTLGRLEKELLNRMIERTFAIMMRAGALEEPPEAVLEAYRNNQADIDIEYEGPLARAQRSVESDAIDRYITRALPLAEAQIPEYLDAIDLGKAARYQAKIDGVPDSVMASEDEAKDKADGRAEAIAQAQKSAQDVEGAKAAKDAASAEETMLSIPQREPRMAPVA